MTVRNFQQKLPRQYLKPLLLLTFEDPTTWQVYSSVGENTANAAKLLCLNVAEGPRECGCAEVRVSKGDADDVVSQDLPTAAKLFAKEQDEARQTHAPPSYEFNATNGVPNDAG